MVELDRLLSRLTRALNRFLPMGRRVRPVSSWFGRRYFGKENRWIVIKDYRGSLKMKLDRASYIGGSIYWHGCHHRSEIAYLEKTVCFDDVVVDAGANIGEFSIALASHVPHGRVLAFEPQSDVRRTLIENVALNKFQNVQVFPLGLSDSSFEADLFKPSEGDEGSGMENEGLYTRYPLDRRYASTGRARFCTLDSIFSEYGINKLDWIKLDIEGGEVSMLNGARKAIEAFRPRMLVEVNEKSLNAAGYEVADLFDFLQSYGYIAYQLDGSGELQVYSGNVVREDSINLFFISGRA